MKRPPARCMRALLALVGERDCFVLTTNVDHQFQLAGFDKKRLFYTQGDYGLWQCSLPCHQETYDNEETVRRMAAEQRDMRVPSELVPRCPRCGRPMTMNLRCDGTFVEDEGWHAAAGGTRSFSGDIGGRGCCSWSWGGRQHPGDHQVPLLQMTMQNRNAVYACITGGSPLSLGACGGAASGSPPTSGTRWPFSPERKHRARTETGAHGESMGACWHITGERIYGAVLLWCWHLSRTEEGIVTAGIYRAVRAGDFHQKPGRWCGPGASPQRGQ